MEETIKSATFLLVLLNPFALSVYLVGLMRELSLHHYVSVLLRASLISAVVFLLFAFVGEAVFEDVLQARFAAFQLFGGLVFVIIAIRFAISGGETVTILRGPLQHIAGAVAMPFMIGPGTVGASILAGARVGAVLATVAILSSLAVTTTTLILIKVVHDRVRERNAQVIERYTDIVGRIAALVIGTVAVEMMFRGLESWLASLHLIRLPY